MSKVCSIFMAAVFVLAMASGAYAAKDVSWVLDLSGDGEFFDLGWPTELRRTANGIDMDGFPNPLGLKMVSRTKDAIEDGYGYSTAGVCYFRFDGKIDLSGLPAPEALMEEAGPIFLVDIDPESPERGKLYPMMARYYGRKAPNLSRGNRHLFAMMPYPGFVLRPDTMYAAGVMASADASGKLVPSKVLADIRTGNVPEGALGDEAANLYKDAMETLSGMGMDLSGLSALTVFRTGDATKRMQMLYDGVKGMDPVDFVKPLEKTREYDLYTVLEGVVSMPQYQEGTPPYGHGEGGRIRFDASGRPIVQRMAEVPIAFSIPKGEMPAAGFPITIYIHGTAGVSTQFIDRGEVPGEGPPTTGFLKSNFGDHGHAPEGTGPALIYAKHGMAGVGAAQQHAGERGGQDAQIFYYNFLSPEALRDNMLQAAAEATMLLDLVKAIKIDPALCPGTETGGAPVRFDPELIVGTGQSLGSLILGPWGAVEEDLAALMPAGNGAYWSVFMAVGNPLDMNFVRRSGKGLTQNFGLDLMNPVITMLCMVLEEGDPMAYQRYYLREPLPGRAPKHVWASFGLYDHYFPPMSQNAAMIIMGLDMAGEPMEQSTREALEIADLEVLDYPVSLNQETPAGDVTAAAVHYQQQGVLDGHHVNYQRDDAKYQYGCFLETLVEDGQPVVYEPVPDWDAQCGER